MFCRELLLKRLGSEVDEIFIDRSLKRVNQEYKKRKRELKVIDKDMEKAI